MTKITVGCWITGEWWRAFYLQKQSEFINKYI